MKGISSNSEVNLLLGRKNKYTKMKVKNKARVEASIVEATLIQEISTYCSSYFAEKKGKGRPEVENNLPSQKKLSIFETLGTTIGQRKRRTLDPDEFKAAHNYVIFNCPEIDPYLEYVFGKLILIFLN